MAEFFPFTLAQLQRFLVLAEELHFTRAAERLNVSQPLLSAQVRHLETVLGAALFNRSSRKVELTEAGALLRQRVQAVISSLQDALAAAREVASGQTSPIRIGHTDEFSNYLLADLIRALKEEAGAEIQVTSGAVPHLIEALANGRLDLLLLCPVPAQVEPRWRLQALPHADLVVGIRKDHPLAAREKLTIEDIANEPFVASTVENAGSELLADRLFAEKGVRRTVAQRASDPHLMNSLAASGVGILLATAADFTPYPNLAAIPLEPPVRLSRGALSRISDGSRLLHVAHEWLNRVP